MTITVTAPNGATVQFPDGTDHATINQVMSQNFKTADAAKSSAPDLSAGEIAADVAKSGGIGVVKGGIGLAGLPRDAVNLNNTLTDMLPVPDMVKTGLKASQYLNPVMLAASYLPGSQQIQSGIESVTGEFYKPKSTAGEYAQTTGEFLPSVIGGPETLAMKLATRVAVPAIASETAGQITKGTDAEPYARIAGGVGAGVGLPLLGKAAGAVASPVISNIKARANPTGYAESQVSRAIHESGVDPNQLSHNVIQAGNDGQGVFTLADAMGNAGQRMLSTVARAPGEGRTAVVNAMEARQAGQGQRVSGALAEGFDSPQTAAQVEARMTAERKAAADAAYSAVRRDAQPVDVSGVLAKIDETLAPYGVAQNVAANDVSASALANLRRRLADGDQTANDFNLLQRVRGDLADEIQQAVQSGAGNKARLLGGALRELDTALENASQGFRQANRDFAQSSRNIEAVGRGRDAAMRGRAEDTIPTFQGLTPEGQQAFRSGYADPLISQTQGAAFGVNKARPFTSDAFQQEASVMAPGNALMQRRLGRENTMFETRQTALGGSKTADNLADAGAMGVDPQLVGVVGHILSGNVGGAVKGLLSAGSNLMTGNTAEVRNEVAKILLQRAPQMQPQALQRMVDQTVQRIERMQSIAQNLRRGAMGSLALAQPIRGSAQPSGQ